MKMASVCAFDSRLNHSVEMKDTYSSRRTAGFVLSTRRQEGRPAAQHTSVVLQQSVYNNNSPRASYSYIRNPLEIQVSPTCPAGWTSTAEIKMFLPSRASATRHCRVEHQVDREKNSFVQVCCQKSFFFFLFLSNCSKVTRVRGLISHCGNMFFRILSCVTTYELNSETQWVYIFSTRQELLFQAEYVLCALKSHTL